MPSKIILILSGLAIFLTFFLIGLAVYVTSYPRTDLPAQEALGAVSGQILEVGGNKNLLVVKTSKFNEFFIELNPQTLILNEQNQPRSADYLKKTFGIVAEGILQENRLLAKTLQVFRTPPIIIDSPIEGMTVGEIIKANGWAKIQKSKMPWRILKEGVVAKEGLAEIGIQNSQQDYAPFSLEVYLPPNDFEEKGDIFLEIGDLTIPLKFEPQGLLTFYAHPALGISLVYPSLWQADPAYGRVGGLAVYYQGLDGFFRIQAAGTQKIGLKSIAQSEISHHLNPYGSNPTTEDILIAGKNAVLITPSPDQNPEFKGQSALIFEYSFPLRIEGVFYNNFILYASKDHILKIAETLKFLEAPTQKVNLYFSNNVLDPADRCEKVFQVLKEMVQGPNIIKETVDLLFKGPSPQEQEGGYFSNLPPGLSLAGFQEQESGNFILEIKGPLDAEDKNSCRAVAARFQLENTLFQFPEIESLKILIEGKEYLELKRP